MYKPRIDQDLLHILFCVSKIVNKPITKVTNALLRKALEGIEVREIKEKGRNGEAISNYVINKPIKLF